MCIPHNVGGILILTAFSTRLSLDSTDGNDVLVQVWSKDVTVSISKKVPTFGKYLMNIVSHVKLVSAHCYLQTTEVLIESERPLSW